MKTLSLIFVTIFLVPLSIFGEGKEEIFLKETMLPQARKFLFQIGQTNDFPSNTNQVQNYKVSYFNDRPGCAATIVLTNRWIFEFASGSTVLRGGKTTQQMGEVEVRRFQRPIKTYYNLTDAPEAKIAAVKALNLQNKLNETNALALAKKYFKLAGHQEENFHPPEIRQSYWAGGEDNHGGKLPYFEVSWYRKDVNLAEVDNGQTDTPQVLITVSGIDAELVYYSRLYLPIGRDF